MRNGGDPHVPKGCLIRLAVPEDGCAKQWHRERLAGAVRETAIRSSCYRGHCALLSNDSCSSEQGLALGAPCPDCRAPLSLQVGIMNPKVIDEEIETQQ